MAEGWNWKRNRFGEFDFRRTSHAAFFFPCTAATGPMDRDSCGVIDDRVLALGCPQNIPLCLAVLRIAARWRETTNFTWRRDACRFEAFDELILGLVFYLERAAAPTA